MDEGWTDTSKRTKLVENNFIFDKVSKTPSVIGGRCPILLNKESSIINASSKSYNDPCDEKYEEYIQRKQIKNDEKYKNKINNYKIMNLKSDFVSSCEAGNNTYQNKLFYNQNKQIPQNKKISKNNQIIQNQQISQNKQTQENNFYSKMSNDVYNTYDNELIEETYIY